MFGTRHRHHHTTTTRTHRGGFRNPFRPRNPNRVAGGSKAALTNPHTTPQGRRHAKDNLRLMGRSDETHVSFMTKVKRTLGIRSTPRRQNHSVFSSRSTPLRRRFGRRY